MKLTKAILAAGLAALAAAGLPAQSYTSPAVAADEKAMASEKRPDFSSPQVEDKGLAVAGLPEKLTWYTSKPGVWGSPRAKQGGVYKSSLAEFPETFRTVGPNANGSTRPYFGNNVGLVELNYETKEFIPGAATHWAFSADGKTVYYKLNEKAKWSDGEPVTADDYVWMYEMYRDKKVQDDWYNEFFTNQMVGLKAYGKYVVAITAYDKMSQADLLVNTSATPRPRHFYPKGLYDEWVDDYNWKAEPTTGPYALGSFEKGDSLTYKKVKDWWGYGYAYNKYRFNFDAIQLKVITGGNDILKNYFYKGDVYQFYELIPALWASESTAEAFVKGYVDRQYAFFVPSQGLSGIFLNVKDLIFSDLRVRQGLYYAINIQKMIDTELRGEYARYHNIGIGHTFAGIDFDDGTIRKPDFDPAKAAALFSQAGWDKVGPDGVRVNAKGDRLSFELIYQSSNHTARISILKEEAKKAGLEIVMKLQQQGAFSALLEKKFQAFWGGMSTNLYEDYWEYFHSKNAAEPQTNNFFGYANPEMDKLLDAFRDTGDLKKKAELDKQIQRLVDKEAIVIPNYYVPYYRGASWKFVRYPAWLDVRFFDNFFEPISDGSGYGGYFGYMWIDSGIQKELAEAQKAGKAYPSRTYTDATNKAK